MTKKIWLTVKEYAEQIGRTRQYINKLINKGKISEGSTNQVGRTRYIDSDKADHDIKNNISHVNKKPVKQSETWKLGNSETRKPKKDITENDKKDVIKSAGLTIVALAEAQKLKENYIAALKKIELKEKQGEYLKKDDVEKEAFNISRLIRDAVLNIPDRISAELASITDVHLISEKLTQELTAALEDLSA
jgi:hypothetical protein